MVLLVSTSPGPRPRTRQRFKLAQRQLARVEALEPRLMLADASAPAILQWFDSSYDTIEARTPDVFMAGYGTVWTPPPGRADISDFSVGYDVYDRFDLGSPGHPTLYGTETGIQTLASELHKAALDYHVDFVVNHNGYSGTNDGADRQAFIDAGGYPGFFSTFFGDPDGDFHGAFEGGDIRGRLAGLIDIAHEKNYRAVRNPVPGVANNIAAGTTPHNGRLANVALESNRRFYPDIGYNTKFLFDPTTGEQNIAQHSFNTADPLAGDPVEENALGYLMRNAQWLIQAIGVDGLRIDAAKHVEPFVLNFLDRAVYRANPRTLLDGSAKNPFLYSEVFDGDPNYLRSFIRKDINPSDPGRIGGNRDVLDFKLYFALKENLEHAGSANAWQNIRDAALDVSDDGLHNGSAGVQFVSNHDVFKPFDLNAVAQAYVLMQPGNAVVYFNGKEFGDNRDFPKDGQSDALSVGQGSALTRLLDVRNTHGRGDYAERWIDDQGLFSFERVSSAITLLSNRGDAGYDSRTLSNVGFAPGTHLIELTGNAADPDVDPFNDIPEVVTVFEEGGVNKVNVRFPRNRAADGDYHGRGYAIYGLPTPQSAAGLELSNVAFVMQGDDTPTSNYENGTQRQTDVSVIKGNTFLARLLTNEVRLLGQDSLRDVYADGDSALLKIDGGVDLNHNGHVDFVAPGGVAYGFENFGDKSSPLIGSGGIGGPRGDGEFRQTIDTTQLSEGYHYLTARAFRHRTDGGPAVYSDFKQVIYVDRLAPQSAIDSFAPFTAGVNENRDLVVRSLDKTANAVHVMLDLPAGLSDSQVLAMVGGGNQAASIDRDLFKYGFFNVSSGNHVATVVTYEPTGTYNIQRVPGLFTSTIIGAGLGDTNFDGAYSPADIGIFRDVMLSFGAQFNAAADLDANGLVNYADLALLGNRLNAVNADQPTIDAYNALAGQVAATSIGDFVWRDLNRDGLRNNGEGGQPNVTVRLLDAANTIVASTLTNSSGGYKFASLVPGSYRVEFVLLAGAAFSPAGQGSDATLDSDANPVNGRTNLVALAFGQTIDSLDAGLNLTSSGTPWKNAANRFDVDRDGKVLAIDAVLIINELNATGPRGLPIPTTSAPPPFYDVSGDDFLTPLDAI
jgi:glycosidase